MLGAFRNSERMCEGFFNLFIFIQHFKCVTVHTLHTNIQFKLTKKKKIYINKERFWRALSLAYQTKHKFRNSNIHNGKIISL